MDDKYGYKWWKVHMIFDTYLLDFWSFVYSEKKYA